LCAVIGKRLLFLFKNKTRKDMNVEIKCSNCSNCDLYENNISTDKYFCKITDEKINDIEQHFCNNFKKE
jgi:hypothetical protein